MVKRVFWFGMFSVGVLFFASGLFAQEHGAEVVSKGFSMANAIGLLAGGLAIALAAFAGALAQARTASATLEGIARNPGAQPQMFMPWIVSMALIESLVIYALVIAFMILGKV